MIDANLGIFGREKKTNTQRLDVIATKTVEPNSFTTQNIFCLQTKFCNTNYKKQIYNKFAVGKGKVLQIFSCWLVHVCFLDFYLY